jgi:hypothetical protein
MMMITRTYYRWLALLLLVGGLLAGLGSASNTAQAQTGERCFPEVNQCISGPIRAYWEANGGLPVFGYPITEQREQTVEGRTLQVQWFERDRLEIQADGQVTAGRLGARLLELEWRQWYAFPQVTAAQVPAGCQFFAETGHSMCEPFLSYWRNNGGLERFGFPITEPREEVLEGNPYTVQYFERRRMELHPELPGSPVLLGLLGRGVQDLLEPSTSFDFPICTANIVEPLRSAHAKLQTPIAIGCPILVPGENIEASVQQFERGHMVWYDPGPGGGSVVLARPPAGIIAVIDPQPTFRTFRHYDDTWDAETDPEAPAGFSPPRDGLYVPKRGFGEAWAQDAELREALGWAIEPEPQARRADYQVFMGGLMLRVYEPGTSGTAYAVGQPEIPTQIQVVTP